VKNEILFAENQAQREEVYRLRYEIYVEEMKYVYPNADHANRFLQDGLDATARLLLARVDRRCSGTMRIHLGSDGPLDDEFVETYELARFHGVVAEERISVLTRFMVRSDLRSATLTHDLFRQFARLNAQADIELIFLDCHPHLVNFYTSLGFRPSGRLVNDPIAGLLVPMVLLTSDLAHLQRVGSTLLPIFAEKKARPDVVERALRILPRNPAIKSEGADHQAFWNELSSILDELKKTKAGIFDGLPPATVEALSAKSHVLDVKKGDTIIKGGLVTRTVFVVLSGTLEIRDGERLLALAHEGDVIGEIAFLLESKRTTDVRAASDRVRVLCLSERTLHALVDTDPHGAALLLLNLAKALAGKLAASNLAQLRLAPGERGPSGRLPRAQG
jgi:CRP-like cAMP-binding protein/predicted GNAT family N-acyltransferase